MNQSDSERIVSALEAFGHTQAPNQAAADIIILNTCQVKQHAEDRVLGHFNTITALRSTKPRIVGIAGCMTRKTSTRLDQKEDQDFYLKYDFDFALQIKNLASLPSILNKLNPKANKAEFGKKYFELTPKAQNSFQAMVPISNGCNKFCSYCVVPFSRGTEVYREPEEILSEIRSMNEGGAKELVLLGQTVNSYHPECNTTFAQLLEMICEQNPEIAFIKFTSPYPTEFSDELIDVIAKYPQISNCLHMPVQSGSDKILKAMNRRYTKKEYTDLINRIKEKIPEATFTTDIIVGFPGETEEDFQETVDLYKEIRFELGYVSPYSPRKGTQAAGLEDDVSKEEKSRRFSVLQDLQENITNENNQSLIGKEFLILIEKIDDTYAYGRNLSSKYVRIPKNDHKKGDLVDVKIQKAGTWVLEG